MEEKVDYSHVPVDSVFSIWKNLKENDPKFKGALTFLSQNKKSLNPNELLALLPYLKSDQEDVLKILLQKRDNLKNSHLIFLADFDTSFLYFILDQRLLTLKPQEWISFGDYIKKLQNKQLQEHVLMRLFERKEQLSQMGLFLLTSLSASGAPPGFIEILNLLVKREIELVKKSSSPLVVSVPYGVHCNPHLPVSPIPNQSHYPLHYLTTTKKNEWTIEILGELSPVLVPANPPNLILSLTGSIPPTASLSIALTALHVSAPPFVAFPLLSNLNPSISIPFPLPLPKGTTSARLTVSVSTDTKLTVPPTTTGNTVIPNPIGQNEIIVCYGDIHKFEINPEETFQEFLTRASKRWSLSSTHEIQDVNFHTFPDNMKFSEYLQKGGARVLRIVDISPKNPLSPIAHQPLENPFVPFGGGAGVRPQPFGTGFPLGHPFGHWGKPT